VEVEVDETGNKDALGWHVDESHRVHVMPAFDSNEELGLIEWLKGLEWNPLIRIWNQVNIA
jgi:hypothetical protein